MKKKVLLLIILCIMLFTCCSCGKNDSDSSVSKKNMKSISYDVESLGFNSKFSYGEDYKYDKFEVRNDENGSPYLYFEDSELNVKYRLEARVVLDSFAENFDKDHNSFKKRKEFKVNNYDGYLFSGDNDLNYASIFLKLNKEDFLYYVINVDIEALDENASSENDYVYKSVERDEKIINFLQSIDFKTDINTYYKVVENIDLNANNESNE